jgi:hypothetical protein
MASVFSASSQDIMANPARLIEAMQAGSIVTIPDLDYTIVPTSAIAGLADEQAEEQLLEGMLCYRKDVTGVENTIFISPKGTRDMRPGSRSRSIHRCRGIPRGRTVSVAIADGMVVAGEVPPLLLEQARRFIEANRDVLLD